MGCRTEPAAVHIAHVLQRLDFFQFFNFYNSHDLQQKKNYTHLQQKKKLHDYMVFSYTTYIFHGEMGFRVGPFVLCKNGCWHRRCKNTNFGPKKFFPPIIPPPPHI